MAEKQEKGNNIATPVNILWEGILMIPIFGTVDSSRAQEIMESMFSKIIDAGSKVIILDILGVATMDTSVANHFIKITKGCKLLGCDAIISGISSEIAQMLVNLGVGLGEVFTTSTMNRALEVAFDRVGLEVVKKKK